MFSYDQANNILKICKVEEQPLILDLLDYQKASYQRYVEKTIYTDIEYLLDKMKTLKSVSQVKAGIRVGDLYQSGYRREIKKQFPAYYPVYAKFTIDGVIYPDELEIFRIPAMDSEGILNVRGERRVLLMQLVADETISYDAEKTTLSLALPNRNIPFFLSGKKDICLKYGNKTLHLHELIRAYNAREGTYADPSQVFTAAYILAAFAKDANTSDGAFIDALEKHKVLTTYGSEAYSLGKTRNALNKALSLDRAKDGILSRPIGPYAVGTRVDEEILKYVRKQCINEIYVSALPDVVGYELVNPYYINWIPAGTRNSERLRELLPQFEKYSTIPQGSAVELCISEETPLTEEDIMLFYDIGLPYIECQRDKGITICATFEEEIIGNCTVKLGDVYGHKIPEGRSYDEWVYYHKNPTFQRLDTDHLNTHDLMALYSLSVAIRRNPTRNYLKDKDYSLLKKVLAANELFSKAFQAVTDEFLKKYVRALNLNIKNTTISAENFIGFSDMWIKYMRKQKWLDVASTINPIATVAQVNQLVSELHSDKAPEKMHTLSMSYYGRICPYETPAGEKLGIVNTRAIGAKIENGILTTPYRRVLKNNKGEIETISKTITYLDAQEETQYRIGDFTSLEQKDGKFINTKVLARIPSAGNQMTVATVDAFSLDFINAFSEQHLSPTAALIPFAGANDAVRVTYATHMLKQSILVQSNQTPRVLTSMYRDCLNHSDALIIRAKKDGCVEQIPLGKLLLTYDDGTQEDVEMRETAIVNQSANFLNFHVKEGDHFKKGDILVESAIVKNGIYSPGVNMFVAYLADGYNYEDAIELSEHAADQLISISSETATNKVVRHEGDSVRIGRENLYRFIPEDGILAEVYKQGKGDNRHKANSTIRAGKHSGILYRIERNKEETRYAEYKSHLLSFNRLRIGDKLAGRHSNKGTVSIIKKNSAMPCFMNGRPVDILLNPCGVPSRMNIGQNFEAYLGFIATLLDIHIESNAFNGAEKEDIKLLMQYVWDLANDKNTTGRYPTLPTALHARAAERGEEIRKWAGCFNPDGTANLWNPETGKNFEAPVTVGVAYILKLEHEVNNKFHVRAGMLEEEYSHIYKQPTEGAAAGGGQMMGEWELAALAAYGASNFLHETINSMSDNVQDRIDATLRMLHLPIESGAYTSAPHAVEMFRYLLEVLGIKITDDENILPACDMESAESRAVPSIWSIAAYKGTKESKEKESLLDQLRGEFK
jgi:DNA-directed RNA polymerase beta subunit